MDTTIVPSQDLTVPAVGRSFGIRAAAFTIDSVIFIGVTYALQFILGFVMGMILAILGREFYVDEQSNTCLTYILSLLAFTLYFVAFEWLYGATPGKLMLGMRVIREDGSPCSLVAALIRGLIRYVDGLFFGIPAYMTMKAPLYQRFGDREAKTIVVSSHEETIISRRAWWLFIIAGGLFLFLDSVLVLFQVIAIIRF